MHLGVPLQTMRIGSISVTIRTMKILIFGGTRFMGLYTSRLFLDAGYEVAIANRGTGKPVEGVQAIACDRSLPGAVDS